MTRKHKGYISVHVDETIDVSLKEIFESISDDQLRAECAERWGNASIDFDILAEIEEELLGHRFQNALAIIENVRHQNAITDEQRARQLADMRIAGAA